MSLDQPALEDFVRARGEALLRFAYLVTGDRQHGEDLVQEALIKVFSRWGVRLHAKHPETYVRRVMVTTWISNRRRRSSQEDPTPIQEHAVEDRGDSLAERDLVWRALAPLPERQRVVLVLRFYEDASDTDIAELLGCAAGTVRSLASRALATLRSRPELLHLELGSSTTTMKVGDGR